MKHDSPLRYPGGKASLVAFLQHTIEINDLSGCTYFEPFAGGAGAALRLLSKGVVSELHLNDLDKRITSFWKSVIDEPDRFVDAIRSVPLSVAEWKKQQNIYMQDDADEFELGFATFYLNRCNRSGVLYQAAPIGGLEQRGKWKIDARFNREALAARVIAVSKKRDNIHIFNMDACTFLAQNLPEESSKRPVFVYLDPPYYSNGSRLYMNHYKDKDHETLSRFVQSRSALNWIMSYDDTDKIRGFYSSCYVSQLPTRYSLQRKRYTHELVIYPRHISIPDVVPEFSIREI